MNTLYSRGTRWELKTNAHLVPRGVYTLVGVFGEVLVFEVGPNIQFTLVEKFYRPFLTQHPSNSSQHTSERDFLGRYSFLRGKSKRHLGGVEGMSFVFMHPRLVRQLEHPGRVAA